MGANIRVNHTVTRSMSGATLTVGDFRNLFGDVSDESTVNVHSYAGDRPWESGSTSVTVIEKGRPVKEGLSFDPRSIEAIMAPEELEKIRFEADRHHMSIPRYLIAVAMGTLEDKSRDPRKPAVISQETWDKMGDQGKHMTSLGW